MLYYCFCHVFYLEQICMVFSSYNMMFIFVKQNPASCNELFIYTVTRTCKDIIRQPLNNHFTLYSLVPARPGLNTRPRSAIPLGHSVSTIVLDSNGILHYIVLTYHNFLCTAFKIFQQKTKTKTKQKTKNKKN